MIDESVRIVLKKDPKQSCSWKKKAQILSWTLVILLLAQMIDFQEFSSDIRAKENGGSSLFIGLNAILRARAWAMSVSNDQHFQEGKSEHTRGRKRKELTLTIGSAHSISPIQIDSADAIVGEIGTGAQAENRKQKTWVSDWQAIKVKCSRLDLPFSFCKPDVSRFLLILAMLSKDTAERFPGW